MYLVGYGGKGNVSEPRGSLDGLIDTRVTTRPQSTQYFELPDAKVVSELESVERGGRS